RDTVIETIVERGLFRPELLNRFDGIILFCPLTADDLRKIVNLMLEKLAQRLKDQGTMFTWESDLVEHLVKIGSDRKFGARAMNRAIQDEVERVLADRAIKGELGGGKEIKLSASDLVH
ncbi:MAG: hypothetical protein Q8R25_02865, partial [bacterium]|nr:hypothetical protein [bacterium]